MPLDPAPEQPSASPEDVQEHLGRLGYGGTEGSPSDDLSTRLQAFQDFMGLPQTGKIDSPTAEALRAPRCGNPDPSPDSEFSEFPNRWTIPTVKYLLAPVPDLPPAVATEPLNPAPVKIKLDQNEFRNVVQKQFATWSPLTALNFVETSKIADANIILGFGQILKDGLSTPDGIGNTLGVGASPPDNNTRSVLAPFPGLTICFDNAEPWQSLRTKNEKGTIIGRTLDSVALHEIGHALGLGHSRDRSAVMFPRDQGLTEPGADDRLGMGAIYGFKHTTPFGLQQTPGQLEFACGPNNDLFIFKKKLTGTKSTEIHVLTAASDYQQFTVQTGTPLLETDGDWTFRVAPNRDVFGFFRRNNGSKSTEIHILTAASGYREFLIQLHTPLHETNEDWTFAVADNRDVIGIGKRATGTQTTEVHILVASNNYQSFALQTGTPLGEKDEEWSFGVDGARNVVGVRMRGTGTNSIEAHVLSAANRYQGFLIQTGTSMPETDDKTVFAVTQEHDLLAIQVKDTPSGFVEVRRIGVVIEANSV